MRFIAVGVPPVAGLETVDPLASLDAWVTQVAEHAPDAVFLAELLPHWSGREAAVALTRRSPTTPLIGVVKAGDVAGAIRWFQVGASDVIELPVLRFERVDRSTRSAAERLVSWLKQRRVTGTLTLFPDTPFEGTVQLTDGVVAQALMFGLSPGEVLEQVVGARETELRWVASQRPEVGAKVLIVEDDEALRALVARRFTGAGYQVSLASDGVEALAAIDDAVFDLMVLDLHMPRLDGWSVLRTLQGHLRHRELPVILLSAHDGDVDALKAARAGARAYLKKSGHARDLLASAELLTRPRRELEQRLKAGEPCTVESASVGVCWLLATLGEAHRTGVLELEDQLGRYELRVRSGEVEGVAAQQGSLRSMGATAFDALVASRGAGLFTPQEPSRATGGVWLSTMLSESAHRRTERSRQALRELASRPERLVVNDELSSLFGRSASVDELNVLSALRERRGLGAVSEASGVPAEDVEDIVHHLLWRGVVALAVDD